MKLRRAYHQAINFLTIIKKGAKEDINEVFQGENGYLESWGQPGACPKCKTLDVLDDPEDQCPKCGFSYAN